MLRQRDRPAAFKRQREHVFAFIVIVVIIGIFRFPAIDDETAIGREGCVGLVAIAGSQLAMLPRRHVEEPDVPLIAGELLVENGVAGG